VFKLLYVLTFLARIRIRNSFKYLDLIKACFSKNSKEFCLKLLQPVSDSGLINCVSGKRQSVVTTKGDILLVPQERFTKILNFEINFEVLGL